MFTIREIANVAIQIEENGEGFYRHAMEIAPERELRRLIQWLAEEELRHREYFLKLRAEWKTEKDDPLADLVGGAMLQDAVGGHAFSLEEVDFGSIANEGQLIDIALGFETDSIKFYEMLLSIVSDPAIRGHVERIIGEEHRHVALLLENRESHRTGSLQPAVPS